MAGLSIQSLADYVKDDGTVQSWREDFGGTCKFRITLPAVTLTIDDRLVLKMDGPRSYCRAISDMFKAEIEGIVAQQFREQLEEHRRRSIQADWDRLAGGGHDG